MWGPGQQPPHGSGPPGVLVAPTQPSASGLGVCDGLGVAVGVGVAEGLGVAEAVADGVALGSGEGESSVGVGVGVWLALGDGVADGEALGVADGSVPNLPSMRFSAASCRSARQSVYCFSFFVEFIGAVYADSHGSDGVAMATVPPAIRAPAMTPPTAARMVRRKVAAFDSERIPRTEPDPHRIHGKRPGPVVNGAPAFGRTKRPVVRIAGRMTTV